MIIIDRFEDEFAICEEGNEFIKIPVLLISSEAKEGDVISLDENGRYIVSREETNKRKANILKLLNDLWE